MPYNKYNARPCQWCSHKLSNISSVPTEQDTTEDKKRNFKFSEHSNYKSGFAGGFSGSIINSQLFFLKLRSIGKEIRFLVIRLLVNSVRWILLLLFFKIPADRCDMFAN